MPPIGHETSPGHRLVSSSMLPDQVTKCPHCDSPDIVLVGSFERGFEQPYADGKPVPDGLVMAPHATQNIEGIACKSCNIHTIIEDEMVFDREMLIFDLQTTIATLQGKVILPSGKEWKN